MAKRVRAARHYQRKDTAIRLLADHARPAVRKSFREAFSHLGSLVPTQQVLHFARSADWHNLKRAIHWDHYREVLKAPFGRLVKLRHAGAELGVQKINGAFAQRRRRVRFRKADYYVTIDGRRVQVVLSATDKALGYRLVEIDVSAFDQEWADDPNFYIGEGGETADNVIGGRYQRFEDYLASHDTIEASTVGVQDDGAVGFTNGRHRYAVLRDLGVERMPVAMAPEDIANARKFGLLDEPTVGDRFNFDALDVNTQRAVREAQDELIQQLEQDARDAIDTIVWNGAREGLGPEEIVGDIRDMIGLTDTQAQAVMNYEKMLRDLDPGALARQLRNADYDVAIQDAIDSGTNLADVAVQSMVDDYKENYLDYRAATIAQTESTRAASEGLSDAYQQAVDRGALPEDAVTRYWQVALDEKTCEICLSIPDMNPDGVGVNDDFDSVDGPQDNPPAHANCRCSVEYVTDLDKVPDNE